MEKKKYSSYEEIERELEILKLEKEINYQKLILSGQKMRESLTPQKMVSNFFGSYSEHLFKNTPKFLSSNFSTILLRSVPFIVGWIIKRKRG